MTTDNVCFYLQNRLIQTSQTGGQGTVILPPLVSLGDSITQAVGGGGTVVEHSPLNPEDEGLCPTTNIGRRRKRGK
jgi:hypothetical protein